MEAVNAGYRHVRTPIQTKEADAAPILHYLDRPGLAHGRASQLIL